MSGHPGKAFRRHRAVEQGRSLPPPAPQASIILLPLKKDLSRPRNPLAKQGEQIPLEPRPKTRRVRSRDTSAPPGFHAR